MQSPVPQELIPVANDARRVIGVVYLEEDFDENRSLKHTIAFFIVSLLDQDLVPPHARKRVPDIKRYALALWKSLSPDQRLPFEEVSASMYTDGSLLEEFQ